MAELDLSLPTDDLKSNQNWRALTIDGVLKQVLGRKNVTLDFGSIAANLSADLTVAVPGAAAGDIALVAPPAAPDSEITFTAFVSAANTVTVRAANNSAGAVNPASASYNVAVLDIT